MFIFVRETRDCSKTDTSTEKFIFPSVFSVKSIFSSLRNCLQGFSFPFQYAIFSYFRNNK